MLNKPFSKRQMRGDKYTQTVEYLDSFIDYERSTSFGYPKVLKLERMKRFLQELSLPYQRMRVIHIAGTKGKGSTATFIAYLLADSGYKVGLYTSPHFFDLRERIKLVEKQNSEINAQLIPKEDTIKIVEEFKPVLEKLRFTKKWGKLTFFEIYTAIAWRYFLQKALDFVVVETGLGGRLDATNVIPHPELVCITHIGYDHTDKLGKTLKEISYEKAGIIKRGVTTICAFQRKTVWEVIRKRCSEMKSEVFLLGRDFSFSNVKLEKQYTFFDFHFYSFYLADLKIRLKGLHQVENASLALSAVYMLTREGKLKNIRFRDGLEQAFIEGRFEVYSEEPLIILDIAHNPSSFSALAETLKVYFPDKKIILIFASCRDKDIKKELKQITFYKLILTSFNNPRALSPEEIKNLCRFRDTVVCPNIEESLSLALQFYRKDCLILITGSLFLVAEAKIVLNQWLH